MHESTNKNSCRCFWVREQVEDRSEVLTQHLEGGLLDIAKRRLTAGTVQLSQNYTHKVEELRLIHTRI